MRVKRFLKDQIDADKVDDDDFRSPPKRERQFDKLKQQADCIDDHFE